MEAVITADDIADALQTTLCAGLKKECEEANLVYEELTEGERDRYILDVVNVIFGDGVSTAGEHRVDEWDNGWGENLRDFRLTKDPAQLIPKYHGKHMLLRWRQKIIRPLIPFFDYKIHCILVDWAVSQFLSSVSSIYEFGCGPAYHLLRARQLNPSAMLVGLDWAKSSQQIIEEIVAAGLDTNIRGYYFDFFNPDKSVVVVPNSGIITVAAMEQIGNRFEPFLQFLLEQQPKICVHLEPVGELLDENNLIDQLSVLYFQKRNYLNGYLTRLRQLQDAGKVKILYAQRTYIGSFFVEGHSLIVWSPV